MILRMISEEKRKIWVPRLGGAAMLALAVGILLNRFGAESIPAHLASGVLLGFSIAGNVTYLIYRRSQNRC